MANTSAKDHRTGLLIAGFGVFVLSFDALLVRLAATDSWTVSFWRGLLIGLTLSVMAYLRGDLGWRPASRKMGLMVLAAMTIYGVNTGLFVFSVSNTHAANTVVILASAPFFAALFSKFFLSEALPLRTWVAIALCITGVAGVFSGSLGNLTLRGDAIALLLAISTGGVLTLLRTLPTVPRTLLVAGSGFVTAVLTWPLAQPLALEANQFGWLLLMGCLQMPVAGFCLMLAPRYLPSPEVSLFLLIETILAPIWIWSVFQEVPGWPTLAGGTLILVTIAAHTLLSLRTKKPRASY